MKMIIALLVMLASTAALSQTRVVSVDAFDLSYTGGLAFKHDEGKHSDRDTTTFRLNLNFAQNIEQYAGLMWKAQVNFNRQDVDFGSQDAFESTYGIAGGLLYNFNYDDIKNSFMVSGLIGIERATYDFGPSDDQSGFNEYLLLEGGKRFDLGSYSVANISYAPTISVMFKRYGGDVRDDYFKSGNELRFNFLKFDILF